MDGSLQQEYLYSLLNFAHAYLLLHCEGNSEVLCSKHVKDKMYMPWAFILQCKYC